MSFIWMNWSQWYIIPLVFLLLPMSNVEFLWVTGLHKSSCVIQKPVTDELNYDFIADLNRVIRRKQYYKRVGNDWNRERSVLNVKVRMLIIPLRSRVVEIIWVLRIKTEKVMKIKLIIWIWSQDVERINKNNKWDTVIEK